MAAAARQDSDAKSADADASHAYEPKRRGRCTVELDGFNINAAVRVDADNDVGREALVRYCCRPSTSLERFSLLDDGRVAYRVRHSRRGETHRIMGWWPAPTVGLARQPFCYSRST